MDKEFNKIIKQIKTRIGDFQPDIAIVLGSGWGEVVSLAKNTITVKYSDIKGFPTTTVKGHSGNLIFGEVENKKVLFIQGRFHYYEGHGLDKVTMLVKIVKALNTKLLLITNSTGSVNEKYNPGDLVVVTDHINMTGQNPLIGVMPTDENPVFIDMLNVYDKKISQDIFKKINALGLPVHYGTYAQMTGPNYETPAEIKMLRKLGADVVGMSTVLEAIMARYLKQTTLCLSCVTNYGAGIKSEKLSHVDVLKIANQNSKNLKNVLLTIIKNL